MLLEITDTDISNYPTIAAVVTNADIATDTNIDTGIGAPLLRMSPKIELSGSESHESGCARHFI